MTTIDMLILMTKILLLLLGIGVVLHWLGVIFDGPHKWDYRNPYDRTCPKCKRNEQEECWGDDYAKYGMRARGQWEVYREGDGSCEKKS